MPILRNNSYSRPAHSAHGEKNLLKFKTMHQPNVYGRYITADGEEVFGWYTRSPYEGQVNPHPSNTVPDQCMTPREILDRFANGRAIHGDSSEPQYFDENTVDWTAFQAMDLADKEDLLKQRRDELHRMSALYEASLAATKEKADEERRRSVSEADPIAAKQTPKSKEPEAQP